MRSLTMPGLQDGQIGACRKPTRKNICKWTAPDISITDRFQLMKWPWEILESQVPSYPCELVIRLHPSSKGPRMNLETGPRGGGRFGAGHFQGEQYNKGRKREMDSKLGNSINAGHRASKCFDPGLHHGAPQ